MKLDTEFIRLPLTFDVERLAEEVLRFSEEAWRPHPEGHPGNSALPLIALGGDPNDDGVVGPMLPTPHLEELEYVRQVLASFATVLGRTRLMRLEGEAEATLHVDTNYYWFERVRVHVPIVTSPAIRFICNERSLHMPAGEAWIFDAWQPHNVLNPTGDRRIHLVADTAGSPGLWDLVERGERPFGENGRSAAEPVHVPYRPGEAAELALEQVNFPVVMTPWEQEAHAGRLLDELAASGDGPEARLIGEAVRGFTRRWRSAWARHGAGESGWALYQRLLEDFGRSLAPVRGKLALQNGTDAAEMFRQMLIWPAFNPTLAEGGKTPARSSGNGGEVPRPAGRPRRGSLAARFERPLFIVAPPRSGTSLLFETLARSPSVWTVGGESHAVIERLPALHPANRGWDSNRVTAADARPGLAERLRSSFLRELRDRDGKRPSADVRLRMLEKTPKNALRVPFLNAVFPDATFVYLYRDPRESLASMLEAWESGSFVMYPDLPDWTGPPWSLLLTPEWRKLVGAPLAEIVASQWIMSTEILLDDLDRVPPERVATVAYDALVADPHAEVERLCEFAGIEWDEELSAPLPPSRHTVSPPEPGKWRRREAELEPVLSRTSEAGERARQWLERDPEAPPRPDPGTPFRSVNTTSVPEVLRELGSSLMVTTYQTGRLVCVRELDGVLNSHFRTFESPMGLAVRDGRLAVGTKAQVWEYRNLPQLCQKLEPAERYDACYIPRHAHYTGDIRIHEIAFAGDELWIVATRFSCLATLDGRHSFVPRWRPPFVTELAADDRCR